MTASYQFIKLILMPFLLRHKILLTAAVVALFILAAVIFNTFIKNSYLYALVFIPREEKLKHRPAIYNLGVKFDKFNPATGKAGDFVFSKEKAFNNKLFLEFGYLVSNDRGKKLLPSPTYLLPLGTKIISVGPGRVAEVRVQKETDDFELAIAPTGSPGWKISYDHLKTVNFKNGDSVNAGDVLGTSGDYTYSEITVFIDGTKPEDIENYCPYLLLDDSVKNEYGQKITQLVKDWENFLGDPSIYNEQSWVFPGCQLEKLNESRAMNGSTT